MPHVAREVRSFIRESLLYGGDDSHLHDADSLLERGVVDSTGVLELVTFLESSYRLTVGDEELVPENLDSIEHIVQFVQRKLQDASREV
jgi:acyl carrier protein